MKRAITVTSHHEGDAIVRALDDPQTRAFVLVVGYLRPLSTNARTRVLQHVQSMLDDGDLSTDNGNAQPVVAQPVSSSLPLTDAGTSGE